MPPGGLPTLPKASEIQDILFSNTFSKCCIFRQTRKCLNSKQHSKQTRKASHDDTAESKSMTKTDHRAGQHLKSNHSTPDRPSKATKTTYITKKQAAKDSPQLQLVLPSISRSTALDWVPRRHVGSSKDLDVVPTNPAVRPAAVYQQPPGNQAAPRLQTHDDADENQTN